MNACRRSIKHQFELGQSVVRNVSWFCTSKWLIRHHGKAVKHVYWLNAVAEETTNIDEITKGIDRGQQSLRAVVPTKDRIPLNDEVFAFDSRAGPAPESMPRIFFATAGQLLPSQDRVEPRDAFGDRRPEHRSMKSRRRMRPLQGPCLSGGDSTFWHGCPLPVRAAVCRRDDAIPNCSSDATCSSLLRPDSDQVHHPVRPVR
jgi:hypothetical protein